MYLILVIDISIPYFEKDTFGNLHNIIDSCKADLISDECLKDSKVNEMSFGFTLFYFLIAK